MFKYHETGFSLTVIYIVTFGDMPKTKTSKLNPNSVCVEIPIEVGDKMSKDWTG